MQGTHLPICVSHYSIYPPSRGTYIYLFVYLTTRYTHRVGVRTRNTFTISVSHYSIYPPSRGTYKEHIYLFVYLTTRYTHRVGVRARNSFTYLCILLLDIPTESGYVQGTHLPICVSHYSIYPPSRGTYITYLCISLLDIPTESGYVQGTHLPICVSHYSIYPPSRGTYIYLFVYLTTRYTHRVGVRTRNTFTYLCISLLDIPTESGYVQGTHLPICVSHYSIYPPSRGTYKEHIYLLVYLTTRYTHRVGVRARNTFTYLCISLLEIPTESGYVHLPICVSHYSIYPPSRGTYKEHIYLFVYLTTRYTHRVGVRTRNTFTYLCISLLDIPTESGYVHYLFVYLTTRYTHRVGVRTRNTLPICVSHYSIYPPSRGTYKEHIYLFVYLTTRYTLRVGVRTLPICVSHYSIYPPSRGTYKEHIYLFVYLTTRYTHRVGVLSHYSIYPPSRGTYITYLCISLLDIPTESGYVQGTHLPICVSHYSIYPPSRGTYIYLFVYLTTRYTHRVGVRTRHTFTYLCISLLDIPTESGYVQGTHYLFVYFTTRYTHRVGVRTVTY